MASLAFVLTWATGALSGVSVEHIAWRALAAAALFWAFGRLAGRIIINALSDAIGERYGRREYGNKPVDKGGAS